MRVPHSNPRSIRLITRVLRPPDWWPSWRRRLAGILPHLQVSKPQGPPLYRCDYGARYCSFLLMKWRALENDDILMVDRLDNFILYFRKYQAADHSDRTQGENWRRAKDRGYSVCLPYESGEYSGQLQSVFGRENSAKEKQKKGVQTLLLLRINLK